MIRRLLRTARLHARDAAEAIGFGVISYAALLVAEPFGWFVAGMGIVYLAGWGFRR